MMRYVLIFLNLIFSGSVIAQEIKTDTTNSSQSNFGSIEVIYGNHIFENQSNNKLNSFKSFTFKQPIQSIGISITGEMQVNRIWEQTMHVSYSQVIPQSIAISDKIEGQIGGFIVSLSLISVDVLKKSKNVNVPFGFGFNTGRLKIKSDSYATQKNPFFSPTFFLNPRFLIGKVVLGMRCDYQFDISKTGWRSVSVSKNDANFSTQPFRQTGLLVNFSLGWKLF